MSNVDVQHRAGGLLTAADLYEGFGETRVPLCFFFGMTFEEEAEEFNTVNSTQRKLPKALIETTKGDITERGEISHSQKVRQIAFGIARDKDSVWFDQINMTGGRAPGQKVTYEGMRRSTANMFPAELLGRLEVAGIDPLADIAKPFWAKISSMFPNAWNGTTRTVTDEDTGASHEEAVPYRLKELVGVASLARIGRDIIASAIDANQLLGVYTAQKPAASGGIWDRVAALQKLETALGSGNAAAISTALEQVWPQMRAAGLLVPFSHLFAAQLQDIPLGQRAQDIATTAGLLTDSYETVGQQLANNPNARLAFLGSLATGSPPGSIPADLPHASALAAAWTASPQAPAMLAGLPAENRLGEALLHAIQLFESGAAGDDADLTDALRALRAFGLEDTARRAALQLAILDMEGARR